MRSIFIFCFLGCFLFTNAQVPKVSSGKIVHWENVSSGDIMPRNIDIWLPEGYSDKQKYAVLYMNDGQMLFDSTITWNKQEWMVDETITRLLRERKIRNVIVVGVWNNGKYRHTEYYPEKSLQYLDQAQSDDIIKSALQGKALADEYLSFLVKVVKPRVDSSFSTINDKTETFIMGSSMGGLISMYAMCEYPDIFGGAACLSTHWPGLLNNTDPSIPQSFANYINNKIPSPKDHKIYFDHGTAELDASYGKWQVMIDELMGIKGYAPGNYATRVFNGENHSERAWAKRLSIPLVFLLGIK